MKANTLTRTQLMPVLREDGVGPMHNVLGARHRYKLLAEESGGVLSVWEVILEPGIGAPPHIHAREAEMFYVVEGTLALSPGEGGAARHLGTGSFFYAPAGTPHAFHNPGPATARILVFATPGENLVTMFGEMDSAARDAGGMPPLEAVTRIAGDHGVAIIPPV